MRHSILLPKLDTAQHWIFEWDHQILVPQGQTIDNTDTVVRQCTLCRGEPVEETEWGVHLPEPDAAAPSRIASDCRWHFKAWGSG